MKVSGPKKTIVRAKQLRKVMTKPERLLWWALRRRQTGYHFRKQHPAGPYVLDFYCDAARLCVKVDGESHQFRTSADANRDKWLSAMGVTTLRVRAADVISNLEGVVQLITQELQLNSPSGAARHLPQRGEGLSK